MMHNLVKALYRWFLLVREPNWKATRSIRKSDHPSSASFIGIGDAALSLDDDPQLLVDVRFWLPGWYMLELDIEHDLPHACAQLYVDFGQDFCEQDSVRIPLLPGTLGKRLVYLPWPVRKLRLDPLDKPGRFVIRSARFVWLWPEFAYSRLYRRIGSHSFAYQGLSSAETAGQIKQDAHRAGLSVDCFAWDLYRQTFHNASHIDYPDWLEESQKQLAFESDQIVHSIRSLSSTPLISVVMPVFNTRPAYLERAIQSVLNQRYLNWELCICDDGSTDDPTRSCLAQYVGSDKRIKLVTKEHNQGIAQASNAAISLAKGQYIAFLDHDDELADDALARVINVIIDKPKVRLIYSDEDKITAAGARFDPHFKPDWNPDLVLSQNYICHLAVFEADRLRQLGGLREGYEGSQDHDLLLRFTRELPDDAIVHIPRILYHWRAIQNSTAQNSDAKDYAQASGLRAVTDAARLFAKDSKTENGPVPHSYRVRWPLPTPLPLVSLLLPTRDRLDILKPCVDALLAKTGYTHFELIIIDNQSTCADTLAYMASLCEKDPRVRVLRWPHPFNYSAINNFAAAKASGDILGLINNDVEPINPDWLAEMVSQVVRPDIGCVGAKLYYPDNRIQHAGVILGIGGVAGHSHKYAGRYAPGYFSRLKLVQNLSAVTGACLLVRKSVFDEVGGLDEKHLRIAFNDVDFCLKVRNAGYRNLWTPYAELYHHESVSRGKENTPKKWARFNAEVDYMRKTWGTQLTCDPAYNPNLTLVYEDFSLRAMQN